MYRDLYQVTVKNSRTCKVHSDLQNADILNKHYKEAKHLIYPHADFF